MGNRFPKAALPASDGATPNSVVPEDEKAKPVSGRKKPGLKPGQKIRRAPKLKPALIESIARDIRSRVIGSAEPPYTYSELEGKYGISSVTLRSKPAIRNAIEEARAAALSAKKETDRACANAVASGEELSKAKLRETIDQLTREVESLRLFYQRLALMYRQRGEPMPQLVAEAVSLATGDPINPSQVDGDVTDTITPISRK